MGVLSCNILACSKEKVGGMGAGEKAGVCAWIFMIWSVIPEVLCPHTGCVHVCGVDRVHVLHEDPIKLRPTPSHHPPTGAGRHSLPFP